MGQNVEPAPGRMWGTSCGPLQVEHGAEPRTLFRPGLQHCYCSVQDMWHALFGGRGIIPDIFALQIWIEVAWLDGFDRDGGKDLRYKVVDKEKWIGATEVAALFRFLNLRAEVVDFYGRALSATSGCGRRFLW
jgi:Peptidase family C78